MTSAAKAEKGENMSLNISNSNFVHVNSDPVIRDKFSDKVMFCDLYTVRKTKENEKQYSHWNNAKFVGEAFEQAKQLKKGMTINISKGLIEENVWTKSDNTKVYGTQVVVFAFTIVKDTKKPEAK